jgi:hypothetical protein
MSVIPYDPDMILDWKALDRLAAGGDVLDAGHITRDQQTPEQRAVGDRMAAAAPMLSLAPLAPPRQGERCDLVDRATRIIRDQLRSRPESDLSRKICEQARSKIHLPTHYQQTGSCVGCGADRAITDLSAVEIAVQGQPEEFHLTFMPYIYGRSRSHAGMGGRQGEGSFGAAAGKAAIEDGVLWADAAGLPQPSHAKGLTWGRQAEMAWSQGNAIPQSRLAEGRKHPVKDCVVVTDVDVYRDHLRSGRVGAVASMWGTQMRMPVRGTGEDAVLYATRTTQWAHQMMCNDWWWHPTLGEIFRIVNSWSEEAHPLPPTDRDPPGSFWVPKADMAWMLRSRDCVIYAGLVGRPGPGGIDWSALDRLGASLKKGA